MHQNEDLFNAVNPLHDCAIISFVLHNEKRILGKIHFSNVFSQ